ncbi:DUF2332 domain-containing protein [Microbacterium pumilum]|uniref:DUF2332 domain-containing protein n=1 Tax=Microbacterium pumilum TaxID=344165 RepID=UPI0031DC5E94
MATTAEHYLVFAEFGAHGSSPIYEAWARGVASDADILSRIDELPRSKRIATLVFASARAAGAPLEDWAVMREWMRAHWDAIREIALTHETQTNEAGRCATLLPAFGLIEGPIALLEVGTSAGLCLHPDRYSYDYVTDGGVVALDPPTGPSAVRLRCELRNATLPATVPEVVWRAGIDRNPLEVSNPADRDWLETLIWPEHDERRRRLRAAAAVAASEPTHIVTGDINDELERLASQAPTDATLVVFHSAVLLYLDDEAKARFVETVRALDCVWVGNEAPGVLQAVDAQLVPRAMVASRFILSVDGTPRALTGQHGEAYEGL